MTEIALVTSVGLVGLPAQLIRAAVQDLAVQPLHIELVLDEALRQVIQQRSIAGRVTEAEIVYGVDDACREWLARTQPS